MLLQYAILDVYFLTKMLSHAKKLENVIYTQDIRQSEPEGWIQDRELLKQFINLFKEKVTMLKILNKNRIN